jgi:hypothetical protein
MSSEVVADCSTCGRPVREDHSHIMLVPVGRARMFFHAGCGSINSVRDETGDSQRAARETWLKEA